MTSSMLNLNQTPDELNGIYEQDYYSYLECKQFRQKFLAPLGKVVNDLGSDCLDVGCGCGWLADYVTVPYVGIDGSRIAIERARTGHPDHTFHVARLEKPGFEADFGTVVFGGIFSVLIKSECFVELTELYIRKFNSTHFVIYDLQRLDTTSFSKKYHCEFSYKASTNVPDIPDIKNHRKIIVYQC